MRPIDVHQGRLYRVVKCGPADYLTVGVVYVADSVAHDSIGLHRPRVAGDRMSGAGTYVRRWLIDQGKVVLEPVV